VSLTCSRQSERCRVIGSEYEGGSYDTNAGCGFGGWACVNNCAYLFSCSWLVRRGQNASREAARTSFTKLPSFAGHAMRQVNGTYHPCLLDKNPLTASRSLRGSPSFQVFLKFAPCLLQELAFTAVKVVKVDPIKIKVPENKCLLLHSPSNY
jgi:hypothetical protein